MDERMIRGYAEWLAGQESEAECLADKGRDGTLHRATLRVTGVKVGLYDEHGNIMPGK